jgi:hypothetical protein
MLYKLLADSVVFVHLAYVGFVVVAQLLILVGLACRWQWVHNLRFRVIHLVMVEVVALEGWFGIICPMTEWDNHLRAQVNADDKVAAEQPAASTPDSSAPQTPAPPVPEPSAPMPPAPPVQPEPSPPLPPDKESEATFVGQLLSSILYLEVPQRELDTWYVRFGLVTLALFVLFPPRLGTWTWCGLAGVILLWTGFLFSCAAYHERLTRQHATPPVESTTSPHRVTPLEVGVWMMILGAACVVVGPGRCPAVSSGSEQKPINPS